MLDENASTHHQLNNNQSMEKPQNQLNGKSCFSMCQYVLQLENELRIRGLSLTRPKYVTDAMKINSLRENSFGTTEEKAIIDSLGETAIKTVLNR